MFFSDHGVYISFLRPIFRLMPGLLRMQEDRRQQPLLFSGGGLPCLRGGGCPKGRRRGPFGCSTRAAKTKKPPLYSPFSLSLCRKLPISKEAFWGSDAHRHKSCEKSLLQPSPHTKRDACERRPLMLLYLYPARFDSPVKAYFLSLSFFISMGTTLLRSPTMP